MKCYWGKAARLLLMDSKITSNTRGLLGSCLLHSCSFQLQWLRSSLTELTGQLREPELPVLPTNAPVHAILCRTVHWDDLKQSVSDCSGRSVPEPSTPDGSKLDHDRKYVSCVPYPVLGKGSFFVQSPSHLQAHVTGPGGCAWMPLDRHSSSVRKWPKTESPKRFRRQTSRTFSGDWRLLM